MFPFVFIVQNQQETIHCVTHSYNYINALSKFPELSFARSPKAKKTK